MADGTIIGATKDAEKMGEVEEVVTKLVNFEAYIMEICIVASKKLVERNLNELGFTTHGPDQSPGVDSNPAVPLFASKLYDQVRTSMRQGPGGDGGVKPDEKKT
jgi:hypothetical protein